MSEVNNKILNEVKKALYKEKRTAELFEEYDTYITYAGNCSIGILVFKIPKSDMGDAKFEKYMPCQLLIRWLVKLSTHDTYEIYKFKDDE